MLLKSASFEMIVCSGVSFGFRSVNAVPMNDRHLSRIVCDRPVGVPSSLVGAAKEPAVKVPIEVSKVRNRMLETVCNICL